MNDNEVNKIIAEFMGWKVVKYAITGLTMIKEDEKSGYTDYTESLDALVPVWEKLPCSISIYHLNEKYSVTTPFHQILTDRDDMESIQQAAAHATAKAILELDK